MVTVFSGIKVVLCCSSATLCLLQLNSCYARNFWVFWVEELGLQSDKKCFHSSYSLWKGVRTCWKIIACRSPERPSNPSSSKGYATILPLIPSWSFLPLSPQIGRGKAVRGRKNRLVFQFYSATFVSVELLPVYSKAFTPFIEYGYPKEV